MKKILFLINTPSPYQIEFFQELRKSFRVQSYFLYSTRENSNWQLNLDEEYIAHYSAGLRDKKKYWNHLKQEKPDFLIIGGARTPLAFLSLLYAKLNSLPCLLWLEKPNKKKYFFGNILNITLNFFILRMFSGVLAIGGEAKDFYSRFQSNCFELPYSLKLDSFYGIERGNISIPHFLFSGQLVERKNVINLLKAFLSLDGERELTLIGDGPLRNEVEKMSKEHSNINYLGFIQPRELNRVFSRANIFVLPSHDDGWALVVNEAMASEMAIITSKQVGAGVQYIQHGENGLLSDTDEKSVKEALNHYMGKPDLIKVHGKKNRKIIQSSLGDSREASQRLKDILNEFSS